MKTVIKDLSELDAAQIVGEAIHAAGFATYVEGAPDEIMYMPAGRHTINASKAGKPFRTTIDVDQSTATVLQASLKRLLNERSPQRPFFDRDHEEKEAMGWPVGFAWKNSPEPGVYAKVEWSDPGAASIRGRAYRSFSPSFFSDGGDPAKVTAMDFCGGSLVNKPAFRKISPLWCKEVEMERGEDGEPVEVVEQATETVMIGIVYGGSDRIIAAVNDNIIRFETPINGCDHFSKARVQEMIDAKEATGIYIAAEDVGHAFRGNQYTQGESGPKFQSGTHVHVDDGTDAGYHGKVVQVQPGEKGFPHKYKVEKHDGTRGKWANEGSVTMHDPENHPNDLTDFEKTKVHPIVHEPGSLVRTPDGTEAKVTRQEGDKVRVMEKDQTGAYYKAHQLTKISPDDGQSAIAKMQGETAYDTGKPRTTFKNEVPLVSVGHEHLVEVDDARPRNAGKRMVVAVNKDGHTDYPIHHGDGHVVYDYPEKFTKRFKEQVQSHFVKTAHETKVQQELKDARADKSPGAEHRVKIAEQNAKMPKQMYDVLNSSEPITVERLKQIVHAMEEDEDAGKSGSMQ